MYHFHREKIIHVDSKKNIQDNEVAAMSQNYFILTGNPVHISRVQNITFRR